MKHQVLPLLLILCAYSAQTLRFSVFFHFEVSKHMEFVVGGGKVKYPADVFFFSASLGDPGINRSSSSRASISACVFLSASL